MPASPDAPPLTLASALARCPDHEFYMRDAQVVMVAVNFGELIVSLVADEGGWAAKGEWVAARTLTCDATLAPGARLMGACERAARAWMRDDIRVDVMALPPVEIGGRSSVVLIDYAARTMLGAGPAAPVPGVSAYPR